MREHGKEAVKIYFEGMPGRSFLSESGTGCAVSRLPHLSRL
jgi:hypothetical protein